MDEIWERTVEMALDGQKDADLVRTLTLDSMVKCAHGRLPHPSIFDKFKNLQHLSMANIGLSSLEQFPRLRNLKKLILSDNRIAGGLEFLVEAGLESLRDLDLSNNRISEIDDLRSLAKLRLVSLDLYECPVTRVRDYRSRVFGLIRSLKYLDKMDAEGNERPESDEEDDDEEKDDDVDHGSGEIDGDDNPSRLNNGHLAEIQGVVGVDEDEESDANEEETDDTSRSVNGFIRGVDSHHGSNGFGVEVVDGEEDEEEGEDEDDLVEEVDDDDAVEIHEINGSDEGEDGVEDDEDEDGEEDDEYDDEEVDNDERDFGEPGSTGRLMSSMGEIDGHEQGENDDDDNDDDGETGEEDLPVEEDGDFEDEERAEDEEDEDGSGYLVQPVGRVMEVINADAGGSESGEGEDSELEEDDDGNEDDEDDEDGDGEVQQLPPVQSHKRKRNSDNDEEEDDEEDDDDEEEEEDEEDDDDEDDDE